EDTGLAEPPPALPAASASRSSYGRPTLTPASPRLPASTRRCPRARPSVSSPSRASSPSNDQLSWRGADLPFAPPRLDHAPGHRWGGVDHVGRRLRTLLLVPGFLRGAPRRIRVVARRHRGSVLVVLDRPGPARSRGRLPRGSPRTSAGDAGGRAA